MNPRPESEFSTEEFEQAGRRALELLSRYVDQSRDCGAPVVRMRQVKEVARDLGLHRRLREGGMDPMIFGSFLEEYLDNTTRVHHPGFASQQVAVPDHPTALADLVNGVTNNGMAIYEMGPAATAVELAVLEWMLEKIGWPSPRWPGDVPGDAPHGAGVLTHGGSLANLTALLGARAAISPEAWEQGNPGDLVVLVPSSCHYSVARSVSIMGLGACAVQPLEVDELERIVPDALPAALRRVKSEGRRVMALVASACATASGLYDPLRPIAEFCRNEDIWLHVDGAHGASALLSDRERPHLDGVDLADSLIWDAHKMLGASTLCAAVLFRREESFDRLFRQQASYLFYGTNEVGIDLIERTVECTKQPLGLKLFLNLAWRGEAAMGRHVERQYDAARRFRRLIDGRAGFECPYEPESNILCFRYGPPETDHAAIKQRILEEGEFHISSAELNGRRYLRLALMNPATSDDVIEALLDAVERIAGELSGMR